MEAFHKINIISLLDTIISLSAAFVLGGLIGLERQYRQRTAGLRTNVLVSVGSAIFVDAANRLHGHDGAVHVMAYVVSGIGFLGAGVIMRGDGNVRGLNTAATLWTSAAVGACAGADLLLEAFLGSAFVLATNTLLRPIVNRINRQPLDTRFVEATMTMNVIAVREKHKEALQLLEQFLEQANYPVRDLIISPFGHDLVHIRAVLVSTSVEGVELDSLVEELTKQESIKQAFWTSTTE
ncbi:Mg2+ transporter-C, MgtC family [Leptospira inadai serovar Lyme str. 10]|uniref:Protein MgtC n=2 Tax=Leptospira inadai serovar Lyme TaxID=293084 RepID=V6HBP2_9LEPT|nr:MgtC/SapB family protein [Leptospira inadai]EQA36862.1 Mg2+ transporter-C, MgtC family [Leptospira inadai serovar Lyme str. 10]PNV75545.1 MgtC/SapB family protein [Leptospira inadai serovar Lyme]